MNGTILSLTHLSKSYGDFRLGPIDLDIEPGYVVAVVGPNGSGKTTLFRMLMKLVHPDAGTVEIFGTSYDQDEMGIKQRVGYVPERATGHDQMTAPELGAFTARWYPSWNDTDYQAALVAMKLELDKPFGTLSKGMQRRLSFALATATGADLMLLDEPTDGVDPFARRDMLANISDYMQQGDRTVLFATHNMDEVRRMADYIVFLVDGRFLGMYEKDALLEQWRSIWLDKAPLAGTPGVVAVDTGHPVRIVSRQWTETVEALKAQNVTIARSGALDLTEILAYLMDGGTGDM